MSDYEIWYAINPKFIAYKSKTIGSIPETHKRVKKIKAYDLEDVFSYMQAHNWSPNGEARELIETLELHHTSMSVGDIIYDKTANKWYQVDIIGFLEITKK